MSNAYATIDQLFALYDRRTMLQLSGDDNQHEGQTSNVQTILDMEASELESSLGAWTLPLASVPLVLTKWVCCRAAWRLFARRSDVPAGIKADKEWSDKFIVDLRQGRVTLNNLPRAVQPTLQDSDFMDGRSRFDYVLGQYPSDTGPSKGQ
jgi:phage gp36-like protein